MEINWWQLTIVSLGSPLCVTCSMPLPDILCTWTFTMSAWFLLRTCIQPHQNHIRELEHNHSSLKFSQWKDSYTGISKRIHVRQTSIGTRGMCYWAWSFIYLYFIYEEKEAREEKMIQPFHSYSIINARYGETLF